ncbi:MAG: hypothetical protein IJ757_06110 [Clostridiales bacterium]|nr:hypothetical protein [Clostridiales bacterium]
MENTDNNKNPTPKIEPSLMFHSGGTTFLIGIKFADKGDTLEDKIKRMIRKEVKEASF